MRNNRRPARAYHANRVGVFCCMRAMSATGFAGLQRACIPLRVRLCQGRGTFVLGTRNNSANTNTFNTNTFKEGAERSGRYGSRARELAARTVVKQHKAKGDHAGK